MCDFQHRNLESIVERKLFANGSERFGGSDVYKPIYRIVSPSEKERIAAWKSDVTYGLSSRIG